MSGEDDVRGRGDEYRPARADEAEVCGGANRVQHWRRKRKNALTKAKRDRFLEVLRETNNVSTAAWCAMGHTSSFYGLRRRDPAFAAEWEEALTEGCQALEDDLMAKARGTLNKPEGERGPIDADTAFKVLKRRDAAARGGGGYGRSNGVKHVPIEDVERALMKQLTALEKRLGAK